MGISPSPFLIIFYKLTIPLDKKVLDQQSHYWEKNILSKPEMFGLEPSQAAEDTLKILQKKWEVDLHIKIELSGHTKKITKQLLQWMLMELTIPDI